MESDCIELDRNMFAVDCEISSLSRLLTLADHNIDLDNRVHLKELSARLNNLVNLVDVAVKLKKVIDVTYN